MCLTCEGGGWHDGWERAGKKRAEKDEKADGEVICILILGLLSTQSVLFANWEPAEPFVGLCVWARDRQRDHDRDKRRERGTERKREGENRGSRWERRMKETICKDGSEIFNLARHSQRRRKARGGTTSKKGERAPWLMEPVWWGGWRLGAGESESRPDMKENHKSVKNLCCEEAKGDTVVEAEVLLVRALGEAAERDRSRLRGWCRSRPQRRNRITYDAPPFQLSPLGK